MIQYALGNVRRNLEAGKPHAARAAQVVECERMIPRFCIRL